MSSLSNLEGEEVFEASSLGQCDYVGQERISDDELIIIKGTFVIFRLKNLIIMFRTKSTIIRINHCPWCKLFHVWRNWKIYSRCSLCCQASIWIQVSCLWRWLSRSCSIHFLGKLRRQVNFFRTSDNNITFSMSSREQLAVAKFAQCLQVIPKTLAINAALDAADLVSKVCSFIFPGYYFY